MATVRERLDQLTAKVWAGIDNATNTAKADPAPFDSIDGLNADITAAVAQIQVEQDRLTPITDAIAVITAIAAGSRTQAQKDRLTDLRVAADQQRSLIADQKSIASLLRTCRTLTRQTTIIGRLAMFLDGGPKRVRQSDTDGTE